MSGSVITYRRGGRGRAGGAGGAGGLGGGGARVWGWEVEGLSVRSHAF